MLQNTPVKPNMGWLIFSAQSFHWVTTQVGTTWAEVSAGKDAWTLHMSRTGLGYGAGGGSAQAHRGDWESQAALLDKLQRQMFNRFWQGWIWKAEDLGLQEERIFNWQIKTHLYLIIAKKKRHIK